MPAPLRSPGRGRPGTAGTTRHRVAPADIRAVAARRSCTPRVLQASRRAPCTGLRRRAACAIAHRDHERPGNARGACGAAGALEARSPPNRRNLQLGSLRGCGSTRRIAGNRTSRAPRVSRPHPGDGVRDGTPPCQSAQSNAPSGVAGGGQLTMSALGGGELGSSTMRDSPVEQSSGFVSTLKQVWPGSAWSQCGSAS